MPFHPTRDRELHDRLATDSFLVEVFYDGGCPLCRREIEFLSVRDHQRLIRFRDLQKIDFTDDEISRSYGQLMGEIHGRLPDGTWIKGVEVFRRLYHAIGWTWIVAVSRWPLISNLLNWGYGVFARRRLFLTGRLDSCEVPAP